MSLSFLDAPRKTAFRRWMFNIHFYAGLMAGLLWLVVGLTGSLIVFVPELRRVEVPGWTKVSPAGQLQRRVAANAILHRHAGAESVDSNSAGGGQELSSDSSGPVTEPRP
jgi:uncharacterized iron-regulated membrane protein